MSDGDRFDCVVIGGGPAGSTAAALLAEAGLTTLLVERDKVPRFHVGESLMPETYWTLKRLGVLPRMQGSLFPKKFSVQFVSHTGKESQPFYFHENDPHECSQTWQVDRGQFDKMLFDNARAKGADCRDETRVLEVLFDEQTAVGVRIKHADGTTRDVACRVVVDATGQQSLLANRLGLREENPKMRKASIWTYFRGALRDSGLDEGATVILHTIDKRSWFWWIPLPNDVVSVGLVADADFLLKGRGKPGDTFQEELLRCAALNKRLAGAQRIEDFRTVRDFSYVSTRPAGEGWVLIGDAFGFLDPVYSSGVFLALKSGEMAADAIIDGLPRDDVSPAQLGRWADEFKQGMRLIGKLVDAFYTERFSFGRFMKEYPHHRGRLTDLLVGKVFKPGVSEIFDDMEPWLVEARKAIAEDDASKMTG